MAVETTLTEIRAGYVADMSFDSGTGEFWFVPSVDDVPVRVFHFIAEDDKGGRDDERFEVRSQ